MNPVEPPPTLTPLQRAFLALENSQARVARLEAAAREPIAVVGLGCRMPGGVDDADSLWRVLRDGVDAIGPMPTNRWDAEGLFDPDPATPGRIATRHGGFLKSIDGFDPGFFGISPREAQGMDPQQRLLLEVAWEALESAGFAPDRLERSRTGVFVGSASSDYAYLQLQSGDAGLLDAHFASGIAHSVFSGRLSYMLGLQGPSLTLDTACSSSLVAVHLACQSLRSGESDVALAGGVNLILAPDIYIALSHARMLAPDGRCKTFDASADGFARAEGCGVVVLKRLSDARAAGDRVLAVIRGSAVNQDGASSSLTAPNGPQQEAVIRAALAQAGLAPRQVGVIEAHGTGTELGDPLEVQALGAVFGADRDGVAPLVVGSLKTNVGHMESAAGVAGLIKLVLALRHRTVPRHLHFTQPSPHIAWGELPLQVPTQTQPWEAIDGRRIGGVSSFGFSGTNVHVIVEEGDEPAVATPASSAPAVFTLSARDETALAATARRFAASLDGRDDVSLADVCHTANVGRARFDVRAAIVAESLPALCEALAALGEGQSHDALKVRRLPRRDPPRVAFLFTGQGAQYAGMARGLHASVPAFREALDRCFALFDARLPRPLRDVMFAADGDAALNETAFTQPALFALEFALCEMWRAFGVTPNVVMGHSIGELAAACVAGVMSLDDAVVLVAERGRLMQSLPAGGAMSAIHADEARVREAIRGDASLSIAAVNTPGQTVVSGDAQALKRLGDTFVAQGVRVSPLPVSHAFHSPLVDPVLSAFEAAAALVRFAPPRLKVISNLDGRVADSAALQRPDYWRRHIRDAVRFADGLQTLAGLAPDIVLEIGPQPTLSAFAGAAFADLATVPAMVASLRKGRDDLGQLNEALAALWLAGATIDWRAVGHGAGRRIVSLPPTPFQRERAWFRAAPMARRVSQRAAGGHPILGRRRRQAGAQAVFESRIAADAPAFVAQHCVQDRVVLPATAYLDALLAAGMALFGDERAEAVDVTVREAMLLDDDGSGRIVQLVCAAPVDGRIDVVLASRADTDADADDGSDDWTTHVTATLRAGGPAPASASLDDARRRCTREQDVGAFYDDFVRRGLDFGPGFHALRRLHVADGEALGEVELAADLASDAGAYRLHPVLLDGCLQVMAAAIAEPAADVLYLPIGIGRHVLLARPGTRCIAHVRVETTGTESKRAQLRVFDTDGTLLAALDDIELKRVASDTLRRLGERWLDDALYEPLWQPAALASSAIDVGALARRADAAVPALRTSTALAVYDEFLPRFESLCGDYVVQTMQRLGWQPAVGEHVQVEALAARLRVLPAYGRLFARLLAILAEDGLLHADGAGFVVQRAWPAVAPDERRRGLAAEFEQGRVELEFTARSADEFAPALRGEVEPMQLLFPAGSTDTAERLYRDTPTARFYNGLVAEAIAAAAAGGRPLRILEIGAGTGGTTAHVLPRLAGSGAQYTFTDIGALFVAKARERFGAANPDMRFQVLDLERSPESQGLAAASFDVVIASNVVHATRDLRHTLASIHGLLAPGGLLAMLEVTAPRRWFDLTVGLTEGWWAFTDTDLRPDYATLSRERWLALLAECGFDATAALPQDPGTGTTTLQSLLLARSGATPAATSSAARWLLLADAAGTAQALAERLRARGEPCTVVAHGDVFDLQGDRATVRADSADDLRRLVRELGPLRGAVHAWALDATTPSTSANVLAGTSVALLAQALLSAGTPPRLWLLTRAGQQAGAADATLRPVQALGWGVARAIALEHPELRCVSVDLDAAPAQGDTDSLLAELAQAGDETQVAWRAGERLVGRLARVTRTPAPVAAASAPFRLVPASRGSLDGFEHAPLVRRAPAAGEVEIAVEATGLNFKDVLNVLGMYPGDPGPLGGECAGRVVAVGAGVTHVRVGDDVLAVAGGSFASHVIASAGLVQRRPEGVGAEEGAAFPIAFLTAEFCLGHLARMQRGDSVLVHAAAGGVGLAAVRLASRAGARVFATAGSDSKRALLRSLGVAHVFDSRRADFADAVLAETGGAGVDIVLNSLSGELIDASLRATARGGRFVEIGKRGIRTDAEVAALGRDIAYHVVDWGETAERDPGLIAGMLERLVDELRDGRLAPLPRHVFALADAPRAFRFMAQAQHHGKIVLRHGPAAAARVRRDGSYLVTGGLSGLGLEVARWLAAQGAGKLVLIGRRGVTPEASAVLEELRGQGVAVVAEAVDVADAAALAALLARVRADGPPLRGVIHSAGALADAALLQQQVAGFEAVLRAKVAGTALLDELTRADALDFFVLFSSVAAVLGSRGQANHSAANAFLDVAARERASRGLPALSIDWGAWTQVGAAVDRGVAERLGTLGLGAITPVQGLAALERLLAQERAPGRAQVAVLPIDWPRYVAQVRGGVVPAWLSTLASRDDARQVARTSSASGTSAARGPTLADQLAEAPAGRHRVLVAAHVRERALKALGLDAARVVDPRTALGDLGLDSLLAVELRNTLGASIGRALPATLLFDHPSLDALTDFILAQLQPKAEAPAAAPVAATSLVDSIEDMSDDEVDRLLAARANKVT